MTYAFIGLGNMAAAILRGMSLSGDYREETLVGYNRSPQRGLELVDSLPQLRLTNSATETAQAADVVVLAVKPQGMGQVLEELRGVLTRRQVVVSIAAGLPLSYYEGVLGEDMPLVRAMPSISATVRESATALCANRAVGTELFHRVAAVFSTVGTVDEVPERLFPVYSAISGAATAFAFQFADALASAGVKGGMGRPLAEALAAKMLKGSARLLMSSTEHPRQLMDKVCSPGGTTIEGVHALNAHGFDAAVQAAVDAVIQKDLQLGRNL